MKNKITKFGLLVLFLGLLAGQCAFLGTCLFASFLNFNFDLGKFVARIGGTGQVIENIQETRQINTTSNTSSGSTQLNVQENITQKTEEIKENITSEINTSSGSNTLAETAKEEISNTLNNAESTVKSLLEQRKIVAKKCMRGSLLKKLENAAETEKIKMIISLNEGNANASKISEKIKEFLNQKNLQFKNHSIISAFSVALGSGELKEMIIDLVENKFIEENVASDDSAPSSDAPFSNCPIYFEPDEKLKTKLNSSTIYDGARKVENDLKITGKNVKVAILDTGVNPNHEGLKGQVVDSIDYTGEGIIDQNGHGTHVACIVACKGTLYRGNAPDAKILNVKTTNKDGEGDMSDTISGVEWASKNGAQIMNISLGALIDNCDGTDALSRAVDSASDKGVLMVSAAGNFGPKEKTIATPGCSKKALTVGAVDDNGKIADFSSRGPTKDGRQKPDIYAPGVEITSAWFDGQYAIIDGTSQAAPHIAGIAALLLEANPNLKNEDIKKVLKETSNQSVVNAFSATSKYVEKASAPEEKNEEINEEKSEEENNQEENNTNNQENAVVGVQTSDAIEEGKQTDSSFEIKNTAEEVPSLDKAIENLKNCQKNAGNNTEEKQKCSKIFQDTQIKFKQENVSEEEKKKINEIKEKALLLGKVSNKLKEQTKKRIQEISEKIAKTVLIGTSAENISKMTEEIINKINAGTITQKDLADYENKINLEKRKNSEEKYNKKYIPFKDVEDDQWFFYFVEKVKDLKIVSGYKDSKGNETGDFGPGNLTTDAEGLKMALESAEIGQSTSQKDPKNEKAKNHWAKKYFVKAEELGLDIAKNTSDDPNRKITRQEFIRLELEVLKISPLLNFNNLFADVKEESTFAGWIYKAYQDGVISGDSGKNTFRPNDSINRAEIAKIIIESIKKYLK